MIGINIGSLNTAVAYGQIKPNTTRYHFELLLSETSLRTSPTIISFTDTTRLICDQAALVVRKYMNSTFRYLSRFIGIIPHSQFATKEINEFYIVGSKFDENQRYFTFNYKGEDLNLSPEALLGGFINKWNKYLIINAKLPVDTYVFSTPDYFTCSQKYAYINAIKGCGITDFHLINESTAITLYFGYQKFKDYFIVPDKLSNNPNAMAVDPNIVKYIIFIDAGHSKTNFILSKLNFNFFTVLNSVTLPFFGGRNLDEAIFNYCKDKFYQETKVDISKYKKSKLRLLEVITKARKTLTVNQDVAINADSLYEDNDFSLLLTRAEFEKIISKELNQFKQEFDKFYTESVNDLRSSNAQLTNIEMAGELMRTPILQTIVKNITQWEISKTMLTDECEAIGCSWYGTIMKGNFPLQNFQGIYHWNNYKITYTINNSQRNVLINSRAQIPFFNSIHIDSQLWSQPTITIAFYHEPNEIQFYTPSKIGLLLEYTFQTKAFFAQCPDIASVLIGFKVDNNGFVHIDSLKAKKQNGTDIQIQVNNEMVAVMNRELYPKITQLKAIENSIQVQEQVFMKNDEDFKEYINNRNLLEGRVYEIRNKITEKKLDNKVYNGHTLIECLSNIENWLNENHTTIIKWDGVKKDWDEILKYVIPQNVVKLKADLIEKINIYLDQMKEEEHNLKTGKTNQFKQKQIDDIVNLLKHFQAKVEMCSDTNTFNTLNKEFEMEIRKYF